MSGYKTNELYFDVAQLQHAALPSFGSGRLVATNLILTARHVVMLTADSQVSGWSVRLRGTKPKNGEEWKWHDATVVWTGGNGLDLALLKVAADPPWKPRFRIRVAIVNEAVDHRARGIGFPLGSREQNARKMLVPTGIINDENEETLAWGIDEAYQPQAPAEDWPGFSGAAVFHDVIRDPRDLWLYGVAQQVPAKFDRRIELARLAEALNDSEFTEIIRAGAATLVAADPTKRPVADDFRHIQRLLDFALKSLPVAPDLFPTKVAICDSPEQIEAVQRGAQDDLHELDPDELIGDFPDGASLHLQAPGGSGKSSFLLLSLLSAVDRGYVPFFLDVKGASFDEPPSEAACANLFGGSTKREGDWLAFKRARENGLKIFLAIDSLNEANKPAAIEKALLHIRQNCADDLFMIISDRLSGRRSAAADKLVTMLPLSAEVVAAQLALAPGDIGGNFLKLLSIPFFLRLYKRIRNQVPGHAAQPAAQSRAVVMLSYFAVCYDGSTDPSERVKRGEDLVQKLAPIAFKAYRLHSVQMKPSWLREEMSGINIDMKRLVQAGMLTVNPDEVHFSHQLFHDFLAGYYLADPGERYADGGHDTHWRSANFDAATLGASSFDAIDFAVELAGKAVDEFVIQIYDWNYGAAFNRVLDSEAGVTGRSSPISASLRDALISLNAEKRFDFFQHTRKSAIQRQVSIAQVLPLNPFNKAEGDSLGTLIQLVQAQYSPDTSESSIFMKWKRFFTLTAKSEPSDWPSLQDSPIIAWTAANAFRRKLFPEDPLVPYLLSLYDAMASRQQRFVDSSIGIRWRVVHILGVVDRADVIEKLLVAVDSEGGDKRTEWVQYGAVRSLVEIAAKRSTAASADEIVRELCERMDGRIKPRALGELRNVSTPAADVPEWWRHCYLPVLKRGLYVDTRPAEREAWEKKLAEFQPQAADGFDR